jgi:hypothetical protein
MSNTQIDLSINEIGAFGKFFLLLTVDCCLGFVFLCGISHDIPSTDVRSVVKKPRLSISKFQGAYH